MSKSWIEKAAELKPYVNNDVNSLNFGDGLAKFQADPEKYVDPSSGTRQVLGRSHPLDHFRVQRLAGADAVAQLRPQLRAARKPAIDAAFCNAQRVTFAGSIIPAATRSSKVSVAAL